MKVRRIIIVCNVLVCFLLNNLLFTYYTEEIAVKKEVKACVLKEECCEEESPKEMCCEKDKCCANIPSANTHLNFSVIIGIDKKNEALVFASSINTFDLSKLKSASELSEGFLNSLIRPPAIV